MSFNGQKLIRIAVCILMLATAVVFDAGLAERAEAVSGADLYAVDPQPLTVAECGQCHTSHFRLLKEDGGRHRFDCRDCHRIFHAYNPAKGNYAELMPVCSSCHTPPHGEKQLDCLTCHANPHTPRTVAMSERLKTDCGLCHASPAAQLQQFPSAHTEQGCSACHTRHGLIPSCSECHEPHFENQAMETCAGCHPVHKPLQIGYEADTPVQTCGACHEVVFGSWSQGRSKHSGVNCATCHTKHGYVPDCSDCHGKPHAESILSQFSSCLECHLDAHNPPIK